MKFRRWSYKNLINFEHFYPGKSVFFIDISSIHLERTFPDDDLEAGIHNEMHRPTLIERLTWKKHLEINWHSQDRSNCEKINTRKQSESGSVLTSTSLVSKLSCWNKDLLKSLFGAKSIMRDFLVCTTHHAHIPEGFCIPCRNL